MYTHVSVVFESSVLSADMDTPARPRKGLYPIKSFPQILGMEASGTVVALPTDASLLSNEEYQKRALQVGSRVSVVRPTLPSHPRTDA